MLLSFFCWNHALFLFLFSISIRNYSILPFKAIHVVEEVSVRGLWRLQLQEAKRIALIAVCLMSLLLTSSRGSSIQISKMSPIYQITPTFSEQGSHVYICLPRRDRKIENAIVGGNPTDTFRFIVSPPIEKLRGNVHQSVMDLVFTLQENGIDIVAWGPSAKSGKEEIDVENLTPSEANFLKVLFGAENIDVQKISRRPIPFGNRSDDATLFNDGDAKGSSNLEK
ncbi:MAG: hypothetical protein ACXVPC_10175 [Tumebacillaceae bacterium]